MQPTFADPLAMQHRLFAELSRMFGGEVPLYDKSLLVNHACNRAVCDLLARVFPGLAVTDAQLDAASAERHGAIRIGRPDEYRWVARFFACFAMHPHNFFDMTSVGVKSQPVIATAFRSVMHPEHRVFTSLLCTDYFDTETRGRIEALLGTRQVFTDRAKALVERCEREGGLSPDDADALIREATTRIFKWTGSARDHGLYTHLCDAGFKIAADIACFEAHHLNHLTPNTLCMDLYTSAMKRCMGEMSDERFRTRASVTLHRLEERVDTDWLRLHFKHLDRSTIAGYSRTRAADAIPSLVEALAARLAQDDLNLARLTHAGFKDATEGPSEDTPVLLRQDAYRALTEPVRFHNPDGTVLDRAHTARFGEIEQRFYATTPAGRALYDRCLNEAMRGIDPTLAKRDLDAYERAYASYFAPIPKTLDALLAQGFVYATYEPTDAGRRARGTIGTTDALELVRLGYATRDGLRYEDFLPVSAAGIFASNLNQYGTKSTAPVKPTYTRAMLEEIMGRAIIDSDVVYRGVQSASLLRTYSELGLLERLDASQRRRLEAEAAALPKEAAQHMTGR
jgi:uncharacterized glyoxalase superfamily metalloenzyme YdcJ